MHIIFTSKFHILEKIRNICLSLAFFLTQSSPVPFLFLQKTQLHSSLWLTNSPCVCVYHICFILQRMAPKMTPLLDYCE
jgi:hypothetical protein